MTTALPLREIAAFGIPGHDVVFPPQPLEDPQWSRLLKVVGEQRLAGFLHAAIQAGSFPVTDDQWEAAAALHLRWCETVLRLERRLLKVAAILAASDIEFVVLKGTAVAHLAYPDPALRLFGDVDLLFRADQFEIALSVLADAGYSRPAGELRPGFDRRFGKGATLHGSLGDQLDAHRTLVFGTFALSIDLDELFRSAVRFELGGRLLPALGPEARLLHACYHAALGDAVPRYSSVRDIGQMLVTGDHDSRSVLLLAEAWRARAVLARGLALSQEVLGISADSPVAESLRDFKSSRHEIRALASYSGPNRRLARLAVASLPFIQGVRGKAAFLRAMAFPSAQFTKGQPEPSRTQWLRRGVQGFLDGGRQ